MENVVENWIVSDWTGICHGGNMAMQSELQKIKASAYSKTNAMSSGNSKNAVQK